MQFFVVEFFSFKKNVRNAKTNKPTLAMEDVWMWVYWFSFRILTTAKAENKADVLFHTTTLQYLCHGMFIKR